MTVVLAVVTAIFDTQLILMTLALESLIFLLLLLLALSTPIDFSKWTILIAAAFLIIFTFCVGALINVYTGDLHDWHQVLVQKDLFFIRSEYPGRRHPLLDHRCHSSYNGYAIEPAGSLQRRNF